MSLGSEAIEAFALCDQMRAAGASDVEIARSIETWLRDRWVYTREWHYLCDRCADCGLVVLECPTIRCGRRREHGRHEYVQPCDCAKGETWKAKPRTPETAVAAAAKVKPMTRLGR